MLKINFFLSIETFNFLLIPLFFICEIGKTESIFQDKIIVTEILKIKHLLSYEIIQPGTEFNEFAESLNCPTPVQI